MSKRVVGFVILRFWNLKQFGWKYILSITGFGLILPVIFSIYLQIASPKRLIFVLPFLIILLAYGLSRFNAVLQKVFLVVIVIINICFLAVYQFNPDFQREDWRSAVREVEEKSDNTTAVIFKFPAPFAPYTWYSKRDLPSYGISRSLAFDQNFLENELPEKLQDKKRIFVFQYLGGLTDKNKQTENVLGKLGYVKVQTLDYPGVGFIYEYIR